MVTDVTRYGTGCLPTPAHRIAKGMRYARGAPGAVDRSQTVIIPPADGRDQGSAPTCVGHAVERAMATLAQHTGLLVPDRSRLWIWKAGKRLSGLSGDSGVYLDRGCDVALGGAPEEALYPYTDADRSDEYPEDLICIDNVIRHELVTGDPVDGLLAALWAGYPVVFAVLMDSRAWYRAYDHGGVITEAGERRDFCHALYFYGWDAERGLALFRGSWREWLGDAELASEYMTNWDGALTPEALAACVYEMRALVPEAVPAPVPQPARDTTVYAQLWDRDGSGGHLPVPRALEFAVGEHGATLAVKRKAGGVEEMLTAWIEVPA